MIFRVAAVEMTRRMIQITEAFEMRLGKLAAGAVLALILSAALANGASATIATERAEWYTGTAPGMTLNEDRALTATVGSHPVIGNRFSLFTEVGGISLDLTMTGLECVACKITNAEITNKAGAAAMGKGKLKFTGVTADNPEGCTIRNGSSNGTAGTIETKPLVFHADWMHEGKWFQQWLPEAGHVYAVIWIGGGGCASIEGAYELTGTLFSEAKNATGVQAAAQEFIFSPAIETTTGAELKFDANPAELTGIGVFATGGSAFGVH